MWPGCYGELVEAQLRLLARRGRRQRRRGGAADRVLNRASSSDLAWSGPRGHMCRTAPGPLPVPF
ncbi:MAG: hypothetical protein Kow0092_29680 [Deferrisomatales bacterium]